MKEIQELIKEFDSSLSINKSDAHEEFGLENGEEHLTKCFKNVTLTNFQSNLMITEVEPLAEYIYSMHNELNKQMDQKKQDGFKRFLEVKMREAGYIHITKGPLFIRIKIGLL
jgi:hypothetical protein